MCKELGSVLVLVPYLIRPKQGGLHYEDAELAITSMTCRTASGLHADGDF